LKVLLLVMDEQRIILDHLYDAVRHNCQDCTVLRLSKAQQENLGAFLASIGYQVYDRVVIFSRLKRLARQLSVLRCIPGLVFLEHDACQNYMSESKYRGQYSAFYRSLPWSRVLVSGGVVARRLVEEGVDAVFVPKGYDETLLRDEGRERDLPLAFFGSLKSSEYAQRKAMLEAIAERTGMLVTRTESGEEYCRMLNRVRIFVSADVGMGEFMVKNFEAMACGCVLVCWSQGEEDGLLGFEDMKNVVFYRSLEEAVEKIQRLQADPQLADSIARAGKALAEEHYQFAMIGKRLAQAIEQPMRRWPGVGRLHRWWVGARYKMKVL